MGKYLITGVAGTGKTAVIEQLAKRGYTAYSTDEIPEATQLQDLTTGQFIKKIGAPIDFSKYGWNWQADGLKSLLSSDDTVFIGASVSNQEKFHHLFDKIFVLSVDEATLRNRLATRIKDDNYGKNPKDLARVLYLHKKLEHRLIDEAGGVAIDGTQPVEKVESEILSHIYAN